MVTIEQKLKVFKKVVLEKLNKEYEELVHKMDYKAEETMNQYKKELTERTQKYKDDLIAKGNQEKKLLISKTKLENKKEILAYRAELVEQIKADLLVKAVAFVDDDRYETYLFKQLEQLMLVSKQLLEGNQIILGMNPKDMDIYGEKMSNVLTNQFTGLEIVKQPLDDDSVGGFIVLDHEASQKLDFTIKTLIEDHSEVIGKRVNELLNKVGDKNA